MKLTRDLEVLRQRLGKSLHLDELRRALEAGRSSKDESVPEWVIVYRTAHGYCCIYNGAPIEFAEMLDVQVWAEETDVQPYFIGL